MNDGNLLCLGGIGVIFLLVSLQAGVSAVEAWQFYRSSESWLPASGQIINSYFSVQGSASKGQSYLLHVHYSYQVMERTYQGRQISFGSVGTSYSSRKYDQAPRPINHRELFYTFQGLTS